MQGKIVVITGATSGLGQAAAEAFARDGARVVFTARDRARADATLKRLQAAGPGQAHRAVLGDLSLLAEMKRVGAEIEADYGRSLSADDTELAKVRLNCANYLRLIGELDRPAALIADALAVYECRLPPQISLSVEILAFKLRRRVTPPTTA